MIKENDYITPQPIECNADKILTKSGREWKASKVGFRMNRKMSISSPELSKIGPGLDEEGYEIPIPFEQHIYVDLNQSIVFQDDYKSNSNCLSKEVLDQHRRQKRRLPSIPHKNSVLLTKPNKITTSDYEEIFLLEEIQLKKLSIEHVYEEIVPENEAISYKRSNLQSEEFVRNKSQPINISTISKNQKNIWDKVATPGILQLKDFESYNSV